MRIYSAKWSARTRGPRWRTVVGEATRIRASSIGVATRAAIKYAEDAEAKRPGVHALGAITIHVEELYVEKRHVPAVEP